MTQRYRKFKRAWGMYYAFDTATGNSVSLKTRVRTEADKKVNAMNETERVPSISLGLARVYLNATDPKLATRTWQEVMENIVAKKTEETLRRWETAIKDRNFDCIRKLCVAETRPEHFDRALADGKVSSNVYLRRIHNHALGMADGAKFPPVIVFHDGDRYIAADGFHRIQAVLRNGATQIECDVRKGSKTDALKYALGCNAYHGLRRTNADKRRAVEIAVEEFGKLSDLSLAEVCAVNRELVAEVRKAHLLDSSRSALPPVPQTRIGRDGVERRLPPPPMQRRASTGANVDAVATVVKPQLPPPPSQILDATGWAIPTQLIPLWQRADEVQEMLTAISRVKGGLRTAQENKDKLFAEVNFSSALSQLDQAWTDIKTAKPFAVCPTCQGQLPDKCTLCKGRGLISEHRWNTCVTREDKEFRAKAKGRN